MSRAAAAAGDVEAAADLALAAEARAVTLSDVNEERVERLVDVARAHLGAGRSEEARRVAHRAEPHLGGTPYHWHAALARLLADAGEEPRGTALFEQYVQRLRQERSATGSAEAALALAAWGRSEDAWTEADDAEARFQELSDASQRERAADALWRVYLALGDLPAALSAAAEVEGAGRLEALLAMAREAARTVMDAAPAVTSALERFRAP